MHPVLEPNSLCISTPLESIVIPCWEPLLLLATTTWAKLWATGSNPIFPERRAAVHFHAHWEVAAPLAAATCGRSAHSPASYLWLLTLKATWPLAVAGPQWRCSHLHKSMLLGSEDHSIWPSPLCTMGRSEDRFFQPGFLQLPLVPERAVQESWDCPALSTSICT